MCAASIDEGGIPACVEGCPTGALQFGDIGEILRLGQAAVSDLNGKGYKDAYLYGEKELGGVNVVSVLAYSPQSYHLPQLPLR